MSSPVGARDGTSLYMVILLTGILFMMSAMLPQVLVRASNSIRVDRSRDLLMDAVDSGVAFAEARLKRNLSGVVNSWSPGLPVSGSAAPGSPAVTPPPVGFRPDTASPNLDGQAGWVVKPTFDNPDFGHGHPLDFEVRCLKVGLFHIERSDTSETAQFHYTLDSGAWETNGKRFRHVEVNGVITVTAAIDPKGIRQVTGVQIQGINREIPTAYVPLAAGAPVTP